jgi:hypothetical protein
MRAHSVGIGARGGRPKSWHFRSDALIGRVALSSRQTSGAVSVKERLPGLRPG